MSIIVSSDLATAIEAPERTALVRVAVDWDGDGFGPAGSVDDLTGKQGAVTIDRALITDLPSQARLVEGSSAATGSVDLVEGDVTDEGMHPARYFTTGSDSPIGGKQHNNRPVIAEVGFITDAGPQYVRRFTGLTRRMTTTARGRTARLEMLDNRARLRNTVRLLAADGTREGCDGTWIVTQALAANQIYAGPGPRATGSIFWEPLYGSVSPLGPGQLSDPAIWAGMFFSNPGVFTQAKFRPGPFVLALDPHYNSASDFARLSQTFYLWGPSYSNTVIPGAWNGRNGRFELWALGVPSPTTGALPQGRNFIQWGGNTTNGNSRIVRVGVDFNGHAFYATYDQSDVVQHGYTSAAVVPGDGLWHAVGIHWDHDAHTVTFKVDANVDTQATAIDPDAESPYLPNGITVRADWPMSDLHLHNVPAATSWLADTTVVGAFIDRSSLVLQASYEAQPREAWELITEVAAAEQAVALFDEAGIFHYRTRARLVDFAAQTVQRVLTTADVSLLDVNVDDGIDQIRNIVQVSYAPVEVRPRGLVAEDTTQRTLERGTFIDVAVSFNNPLVNMDGAGIGIGLQYFSVSLFGILGNTSCYWVATTNSDGTDDSNAALTLKSAGTISAIVLPGWTPNGCTVRFTNLSTVQIFVTRFGIGGVFVVVGNGVVAEASDGASITANGPQPLQVTLPQWMQTADVARSLAAAMLGDLKDPHPAVTGLQIVGDPRRQLGDRVSIADPAGTQLAGEYWVTQIRDNIGADGGYTQTISARAATTVARYDIGHYDVETYG